MKVRIGIGLGDGKPRRSRSRLPDQIEQQHRSRVAGLVHEVTEPRDPLATAEQFADHARCVTGPGGQGEHHLGAERGTTVQRTADGARPVATTA